MYNLKKLIVCMAGAAFALNLHAQQVQGFVHKQSEATDYVWPTDQQVLDKLDKWQDQKFGVLFHWGLYSVPGIVSHGPSARKMSIGFHAKTFAIR